MKEVGKIARGIGNIEVREIEEPMAPAGSVKIAVRAAGICGTDLHIYRRLRATGNRQRGKRPGGAPAIMEYPLP
jgi:threonine dehydrogenase-like Zn-dependent dehydrogenase